MDPLFYEGKTCITCCPCVHVHVPRYTVKHMYMYTDHTSSIADLSSAAHVNCPAARSSYAPNHSFSPHCLPSKSE